MEQAEWLERYAQRLVKQAALTEDQARKASGAEEFSVLSEDFEDDPEGAADEEMSYWSD
jgi:hypothetical protein